MDVHSDIDVMHHVSSAGHFKFRAPLITVDAPKHDLALAKHLRPILPSAPEALHFRIRLQSINDRLRDVKLRSFRWDIESLRPNQSIEIGLFDDVSIKEDVAVESDVSELLNDMRTAAAKSRDANRALRNALFRIRA